MGWRVISTAKGHLFFWRVGEQVAAKGVTVVDDGTIKDRRGL